MKNLLHLLPAKIFSVCCLALLFSLLPVTRTNAHTYSISTSSFVVYTDTDFSITIVIDSTGIAPGGSITIQLPPNWGTPQFTSDSIPNGQNPVKISCTTNASVHFHDTTDFMYPIYGIYTNEVHYCIFTITSSAGLVAGDIVQVKYGNHGGGGWGFQPSRLARTEQIYFQTKHDTSTAPGAIDSLPVIQTPLPIYRLNALAKSNPSISTPFQLNVVALDKLNNPVDFYTGTIHFSNVDGDSSQISWPPDYTFTPNDAGVHQFTLSITDYNLHRIKVTDVSSGMNILVNPLIVDTTGNKVFWGDLHTHSQYSHHGLHYPIDVFNYGKDITFLDYLAFTEHSYIPDSQYRAGIALGNQFNQDGSFVTFNGYEWSTANFGHQVAIFNNSNPPSIINTPDPTYFQNSVKQSGGLIDIAHSTGLWGGGSSSPNSGYASFYVDWDYFDPAVQTMVEVTGNSGICFEYYDPNDPYADTLYRGVHPGSSVQDGLARHYIFGMIGASDNHQGRPGRNPNPEANSAYTYVYPNTISKDVGICAAIAPALTRNDVFNSLGNRHDYATTGARILMKFNIGTHSMGDYFVWDSLAGWPNLTAAIHGTDTISEVDIVKNNQTMEIYHPNSFDYTINYIDSLATFNTYYYIRVFQTNTDMAWSSPIWLLDSSTFTTNQLYLQTKFDVDIYPNPNDGNFILKFFNNYSSECLITVADITGKEIYNSTVKINPFSNASIPMDIPGLSSGMYLLNVSCDNYLVHKKLIVEKSKK